MNKYRICNNCIMDTSDPTITFDDNGICHFCINFKDNIKPNWFPNNIGFEKITPAINKIKESGKNKEYDCIMVNKVFKNSFSKGVTFFWMKL